MVTVRMTGAFCVTESAYPAHAALDNLFEEAAQRSRAHAVGIKVGLAPIPGLVLNRKASPITDMELKAHRHIHFRLGRRRGIVDARRAPRALAVSVRRRWPAVLIEALLSRQRIDPVLH